MKTLCLVRAVVAALASTLCLSGSSIAQDAESTNSLGDVARQTRAQLAERNSKARPTTSVDHPSAGPANTAATRAQDSAPTDANSQPSSLANLARETRQATLPSAHTTLQVAQGNTTTPAGFQSFVMPYCQNPQHCAEALIVIPEHAEVVSRVNGQHIFKAAIDDEPVMLYAGPADVNAPYRSLTDPDYIRMRDLGSGNASAREKPDSVSKQDMTIEGRTAVMTRFRFQRDQKWWIGERVLIEGRVLSGDKIARFLLGCAAPQEHFADAEMLCTTLVNSLRLP
ncbi:MAG TPA: hypothetical protein VGM18_07740 [Candidatus Sulfotelmatobacter sp.]